jgi:lipopolysaccharide/colanic/teichoic acid biosynthesis glycosyltransferase
MRGSSDRRHLIRSGITGWAQVRYHYGASLEETKHKLEYDLYYVKHPSIGLDLLIMFEPIKTILLRRGAQLELFSGCRWPAFFTPTQDTPW